MREASPYLRATSRYFVVACVLSCASTGHDSSRPGGGIGGTGDDGGLGELTGDDAASFEGGNSFNTDCRTLTHSCDSCADFPAAPIIDRSPGDGSPPPPL